MHVFRTFSGLDSQPIALTVGNFDGVHLGHQAMLQSLVKHADGCIPSVMTFDPHPKCVFASCNDYLLTDTEERLAKIAEQGIQRCWLMNFDPAFRALTADNFIKKLRTIHVHTLTVGEDFRFGHKGQGDVETLRKHFEVNVIETQTDDDGTRISSSLIRTLIREGNFRMASERLGRRFSYEGVVVHGQKLGRTLNFPTANLAINDTQLMPAGVFAVDVHIAQESTHYRGVANCGRRPTVSKNAERLLEVFLFDFEGDLYDKTLTVTPVAKIRDEQKFTDLTALKEQIKRDVSAAKQVW